MCTWNPPTGQISILSHYFTFTVIVFIESYITILTQFLWRSRQVTRKVSKFCSHLEKFYLLQECSEFKEQSMQCDFWNGFALGRFISDVTFPFLQNRRISPPPTASDSGQREYGRRKRALRIFLMALWQSIRLFVHSFIHSGGICGANCPRHQGVQTQHRQGPGPLGAGVHVRWQAGGGTWPRLLFKFIHLASTSGASRDLLVRESGW